MNVKMYFWHPLMITNCNKIRTKYKFTYSYSTDKRKGVIRLFDV